MSKQDAYQDGREQGWRDKEREFEVLKAEVGRLRREVDDLRAEVNYLKHVLGHET